ncbi:MAG: Glycosyl transferase, family 4 [uncultured bacterium]|nr:MAG: Glycosyl transferase, family 4 [uncultured bacterium]
MNHEMFWLPLFVSFAISAFLLSLIIFFGRFLVLPDKRKSKRHLHRAGILRFGGIAIIVSFVSVLVLDKNLIITQPLMAVLIASFLILVIGVVDDVKQLSWREQLFFQFFIVIFVYIMGVRLDYVTNPFGGIFLLDGFFWQGVGLVFSVAWIVFLMNAMNWVDGVDGASSGIAIIGVVTIFFLSLRPEVNQPPVAIICAALIGSILAFLFLNFYPAKVLAGTSGSMFMGFILGITAIFSGAKIATTLLVLAVPIIDAIWVIGERLKAGDSIFSPDKRHLHFRLLDLGWSVKKICFFYYLVTAVVAFIALNTRAMGKSLTLLLVALIMLGVYTFIKRKTAAFEK